MAPLDQPSQTHCITSLTLLLSLTDPTHVIGLYPDLLPSDYRKQLHYPNPLPTLSGAELEKAHLALIDYLTQVLTLSHSRMRRHSVLWVLILFVFDVETQSSGEAAE